MALTGKTNEEKIWNFLKAAGMNDCGAAGMMGNLYAESALSPTNLQQTYEKKLGYTDASYTEAVDGGAYTNFVRDSAGYGLAQWTYWSRKQNLLDYAKSLGKSIGDLEMQLGFLLKELTEGYKSVLNTLKTAATVKEASDSVLVNFERPADQSTAAKTRRAGYGQKYYDKYAATANSETETEEKTVTEQELRNKVVSIAVGYVGCKESDGSHKKIIDLYNSHKPLARGYTMKYTDAWCSTFASAVAIAAGLTDIIPTECGCEKHIELFKKLDSWQENDAYVPSPGDYIFYDWDDNNSYATTDNTGWADHVGIVTAVSGSTLTIVEGNISNAVGYRKLTVNGKYIRGYGVPKYSSKAGKAETSTDTGAETATGYAVGDIVTFTGTKHYTSSSATAAKSCKPGTAKVTNLAPGTKHPYHLIKESGGGSTVYGWVNAEDISGKAGTGSSVKTHKVVRGDTLWKIAETYLGSGSRYTEIVSLNGLKSTTIRAGQVLKIPAN